MATKQPSPKGQQYPHRVPPVPISDTKPNPPPSQYAGLMFERRGWVVYVYTDAVSVAVHSDYEDAVADVERRNEQFKEARNR